MDALVRFVFKSIVLTALVKVSIETKHEAIRSNLTPSSVLHYLHQFSNDFHKHYTESSLLLATL